MVKLVHVNTKKFIENECLRLILRDKKKLNDFWVEVICRENVWNLGGEDENGKECGILLFIPQKCYYVYDYSDSPPIRYDLTSDTHEGQVREIFGMDGYDEDTPGFRGELIADDDCEAMYGDVNELIVELLIEEGVLKLETI